MSALVAAKHDAERRIRARFQERWGAFWKCRVCGARLGARGSVAGRLASTGRSGHEHGDIELVGYDERIAEAAILVGTQVWSVPAPGRHHDVIELLVGVARSRPQHAERVSARALPPRSVQGFVTSVGRFCDRKRALRIAVLAGQYRNPSSAAARNGDLYGSGELFSEDLW